MSCDYERLRQQNIEQSRRMLSELGLLKPYQAVKKVTIKTTKRCVTSKPRIVGNDLDNENTSASQKVNIRRRSSRLQGKSPEESNFVFESEEDYPSECNKVHRQGNVFGPIIGLSVGTIFESRLEASRAGIHRPTVAGIHGHEVEGCYSLALSGGYEDDLDMGDFFTYTGEGGRDLKGTKANPKNLRTAPQSKDQTLSRGNLALTQNITNRRPVRVLRGYKLRSEYAPDYGYRYDGLYSVEKYWSATGLSGYLVYKYILKRCDNQEVAPWLAEEIEEKEVPNMAHNQVESDSDSSGKVSC